MKVFILLSRPDVAGRSEVLKVYTAGGGGGGGGGGDVCTGGGGEETEGVFLAGLFSRRRR